MNQQSARRSNRSPYAARLLVRGACGQFAATGLDISRTGVRLAMLAEVLRLDPEADLAAAAACIQTRVGSRFVLDLGLTAAGRGRVRKEVELVRLVLDGGEEDVLELGCRFDAPLSNAELGDLGIDLPEDRSDEARVRQVEAWTDAGRPALDPRLAEEKVESLLGVPVASPRERNEHRPDRTLRALLRPEGAGGAAPLVGRASGFTEATVRVRIDEADVRSFGAEPGDFTALARALEAAYGAWPTLEILDGTRRLWHGSAHPSGLEVAGSGDRGAIVRLAFGRRLQPAELERLVA